MGEVNTMLHLNIGPNFTSHISSEHYDTLIAFSRQTNKEKINCDRTAHHTQSLCRSGTQEHQRGRRLYGVLNIYPNKRVEEESN